MQIKSQKYEYQRPTTEILQVIANTAIMAGSKFGYEDPNKPPYE